MSNIVDAFVAATFDGSKSFAISKLPMEP